MTIRSTVNATIKTISRDGIRGQSLEHSFGSIDGIAAGAAVEWDESQWLANKASNPNTTITPIYSNSHDDGTTVQPT